MKYLLLLLLFSCASKPVVKQLEVNHCYFYDQYNMNVFFKVEAVYPNNIVHADFVVNHCHHYKDYQYNLNSTNTKEIKCELYNELRSRTTAYGDQK